jgi:hypothetical protein
MTSLIDLRARVGVPGSLWAAAPDPGNGQAPAALVQKMDAVIGLVAWLAVAACVAGVLIVAIRMALLHRRGELGEHMSGLGSVAGACVLIGAASGLVNYFI